jgi:hypothetical protein
MLPSACSFIVDVSLSYIYLSLFFTTWPSSGVYDVFIFIFLKESASLVLLARGYALHMKIKTSYTLEDGHVGRNM